MARIPEAEIERLKEEVSVERLVLASGVELKKSGKDFVGCCPFHEDSTASLVVTPAKNLWHCFGCQIGGGPIDWVMKKSGVSFRHAVELLRADPEHLSLAASDGAPVKQSRIRKLPAPVALDAGEQELLNQVIGFYHERLLASPEALAYLAKRGLDDRELIERHRLGFVDRTLGLRLPQTRLKAGAEVRARLQKIGLLRETGHEHLRGCITVPVFDEAGNVTDVYGRRVDDHTREDTPRHFYLPGPHKGLWNVRALQGTSEVILCEALLDAMTFWCAGFKNVTSAYGVEGFNDDMLTAFTRHKVTRVLIAFDRDEAGDRGAAKVAERLMAAGIDCYRIQFPKGIDANEYALKVTPADKSLGLLIRKAVWLGKGAPPNEAPGQQVAEIETVTATQAVPVLPLQPPPLAAEVPAQISDDEIIISCGERRYRIRALSKNLGYETLKVNVLVSCAEAYYVDTLDLYAARARNQYIVQAAKELALREEIVKADLGRVLLKLEALQDARIKDALEVKSEVPVMSEAEHTEALALLKSPDLLARILADFDACGLVGEATNKLVGYLAAVSRKLDGPLAIVVQSSSAAGKSSLMDAVLAFVPEEERIQYSAMTGQSLFYMGETNLKHKILAIAEEEGASRASYALKLLQSEGVLTIASTGKDPNTGNLVTQQYRVEGPVMIFLTTTAIEIDEELLNRCIVLSVDEGRAQTEAIHKLQRHNRTLAGLAAKQHKARVLHLHRCAQRLLRPLAVVNPYADQLSFLSDKTRTRRDHEKYLTLIDTIALLHQHQRTVRTLGDGADYIEVTLDDIAQANALAHEVLGRSLDELPPVTRRLLNEVAAFVAQRAEAQQLNRQDVRFTRRDVREASGLSDTQLRVHLDRLVSLEYVLTHRGMRGQSFEYELLYDGAGSSEPHLSGLLDVTTIQSSRGQTVQFAGSSRPQSGANAAPSRKQEMPVDPHGMDLSGQVPDAAAQTHVQRGNGKSVSYAQVQPSVAEAVQ